MLTPPELIWLLATTAKGDEAAFARLYATSGAKLYGIVLRLLGHTGAAQEAMRAAYLEIWDKAGTFDPRQSNPIVWMTAIARRHAIDLLRQRSDLVAGDEANAMEAINENSDAMAHGELGPELQRLLVALGQLPPKRQRLLLLAYYNGLSREQLARELKAPADSIKVRLRRTLLQLREGLAHG